MRWHGAPVDPALSAKTQKSIYPICPQLLRCPQFYQDKVGRQSRFGDYLNKSPLQVVLRCAAGPKGIATGPCNASRFSTLRIYQHYVVPEGDKVVV